MGVYLGPLYQQVEYIQSSGTQWIDTGVTPTSNTKSQIKFRNLGVTGEVIYGTSVQSSGNTNYRFFNYNSKIYFDLNYPSRISGSTCNANTDYEFEIGNFYVKNVGGTTNLVSGSYVSGYTGTTSIKLNYSDWNGTISSNRWYYVKIYENGALVRDFIPCYRKSDNVIGLFDRVENKFYTNAGTGAFTKGNDVGVLQPELKNAYIGEVWTPGSNTVAYYPLTSDVKDYSGNGKNGTLNGSASSYTGLGIQLTTSSYITLPTMGSLTTPTFSIWVNVTSASQFKTGEYYYNSTGKTGIGIGFWTVSGSTNARPHGFIGNGSGEKNVYTASDKAPGTRNHYLITYDGSTVYFYINGVLNKSETYGLSSSNLNTYNWYINGNNGSTNQHGSGVFSDCIVESAYWTATEVANYFNLTKSNYGL